AHAPDGVKIIYGVEGYFINDLDSRPAIFGELSGLDEEFVVFDLETTGLDSYADKITEIAAVTIRGGEIISEFHTYANPGIHIPREITELTGITDEDVLGAPDQVEAVRAFLDYAGARPLAAHNASFDLGFVYEVCFTNGIPFDSACLDTLSLARALFPELYNHKLPTVSSALRLPVFDHHHALADAKTTGLITIAFIKMLKERGLYTAEAVNKFVYDAPSKQRRRVNHIIILTKTQAGLKNLYRIITDSHLEHFHRNPIIPKSLLTKYRDGLIIGSACEAGEIFASVERGSRFERHRLARFYDYLEIQPVSNNFFMLRGAKPRARDVEQLRGFNRAIVELGRETGKPVCATGDVHFLDPEDEIFRKILLNTKGYESALEDLPLYFRTTEEMLEEFAYLGEGDCYDVVVTNTRAVSDMIEKISPLPPPKKLFAPQIENSAEDLKTLVYSRLRELYGETPPELVTSRVETELSDILGRGYDVIYITAQRLVRDSGEHGYLVGSRGSVGSSVVAYLAGITEVNALPAHYRCPKCRHSDFESGAGFGCGADMPDKACPVCSGSYEKHGFDIPFETFLGFGGDKVPDIDLNFSGEYQAEAHKFTTELFGAEHVFRAGTIGTVKEKTAFGYVKKYLETIDKTVTRAEENRLAQGCVGVKRTTGQHPGGLVVIPQGMDITDFCPAQRPADDAESDIITTHFEYHCMEDNLLKLDELGHDDPTMIRMLEEMTDVSALDIPLGDPETLKIFSSPSPLGTPEGDAIIGNTGTIGISEFGTGFTRQMLVDTLPDKVDTLVRLSGYSHGTDVWAGNARDIIMNKVADISETIGCRDDITLYLVAKGMEARRAYKISEAVRKGRGVEGGDSAEMTRLGVPEWYIESCKKIKYLFPKAHAAAYVMMALRIAWFKVHRPIAFYAAYFYRRSQKGNFDAKTMTRGDSVALNKIREIRAVPDRDKKDKEEDMLTTLEACHEFYARGFSFLDVDLYESDAVKFAVVGETSLRPPLIAVAGLGETAARDIAERRRGRTFISIEDFSLECSKVSSAHISAMSELGAFGSLPATSQYSMFS
ncbi:MAG: PolC-type DNA polymerase III, partial [Oscillospiraceae bacterium]|nr:PolC-type DNA polymerase III [Oscillospiraceae bacterium]